MASRNRRDYPRKLLVEGETDKRVIPYLMEANGVMWPDPPASPVFIEPYGSVDEILKPEVIELEIGASGLEALGVVVDANGDAAARWDGVKTWCGSEFADLPEEIPDDSRPLYELARNCVAEAQRSGAPFRDVHERKAEIYTWLAWQDPPDLRLHEAVKHTVLRPDRAESQTFVNWFRRLFRV